MATAALLLGPPQAASAQLRHVEQLIFGMDCAPCAYGVQRRMERFEGVTSAVLSLNRGTATLEMEDENEVTLHLIRDSIRRGGFSPQHARIIVAGTLHVDDEGNRGLVFGDPTESGERYHLRLAEHTDDGERAEKWRSAWRELNDLEPGRRVLVTGRVPRTEADEERDPGGLPDASDVRLPLYVYAFEIPAENEEDD